METSDKTMTSGSSTPEQNLIILDDNISDTSDTPSITDLSLSQQQTLTTTNGIHINIHTSNPSLPVISTTQQPIITTTNSTTNEITTATPSTKQIDITKPTTTNNNIPIQSAASLYQRQPLHNTLNKVNSIVNNKSNSSSNLKDGSEKKPEPSKLETMIISVKADNMVYLAGVLKTKPYIPLTVLLPNKDTLLHIACKSLKMVSVIYLLEKTKSDLVNCQNDKLKSPFFLCCENGFFKAATLLLDQGASPLLSNNQKWTPLHKLCSLELKKVLYTPATDQLIGYSSESLLDLVSKIFQSLERLNKHHTKDKESKDNSSSGKDKDSNGKDGGNNKDGNGNNMSNSKDNNISNSGNGNNNSNSNYGSIVGSKTSQNQTPLHLSLISCNLALSKYLLTHSNAESLRVRDNKGNTVLHILAYKYNTKMYALGESILKLLSEQLGGEQLQDFIDDVNNEMASALQISMKNGHTTLCKLIVRFRAMAEHKILESFFSQLDQYDPLEILKIPLDSIVYNDEFRNGNSFGKLMTRIIIIIKQHYTINMSHQNANILLKRAKETLNRLFEWLDLRIDDQQYSKAYKELVFTQIYDTIIHLYQETNKSKDLLFQQRVEMFKSVEYHELDISESSWEKNVDLLPKALEIINSLQNKKTPSEKIGALNDATMQISRTDANDLTPMFMYLLIKSNIAAVQSQFQFMNDFKETPEQEQYLVLLHGSLDYLDTLNVTLRNSQNQVMSLSGIVERTIDNLLSLLDEFQNQPSYNGADQIVDDFDEGIQIADEIILLIMMLSKLSNRVNNDPLYLELKWCKPVLQAYHFRAVIERLGLRLESDESVLIKTNNSNLVINNNSPAPNKLFKQPSSTRLLAKSPSLLRFEQTQLSISLPIISNDNNGSSVAADNNNGLTTQSCNIINNNVSPSKSSNLEQQQQSPIVTASTSPSTITSTTTTTTSPTSTITTTTTKTFNINNLPAGYICNRKGEICVILEHPYPQMVYQIIEEKIREVVLPKLKQ